MKRTGWMVVGLCLALLPLILFAPSGCEVGSADSVVRLLGIDFSGFYQGNPAGTLLVSTNTGKQVNTFNLRQNGDQLEVIDNNGLVFRGVLGNLVEQTASFTLSGQTTVGNSVTVSGTLTGEGTEGTMQGTWIEPNLYATISGMAVINPAPTNVTPTESYTLTVSISPTDGGSVTLNPSGGIYSNGTVVSLQAIASSGFSFSVWSGDLTGSSNPGNITMTDDKSVTAFFAP